MGRGLHNVLVRRRAPPPSLVRVLLRHAGVGAPCGRDPRGSSSGRWGARCAGPAASPPPRRGPFWGRGGAPSAPGGRRVVPVLPKLRGGSGGGGGGGWGGRLPAPPPRQVSACHPLSLACPPGYTRAVGVAGRRRVSGAAWSAANGSVRRGGGGRGGKPPRLGSRPRLPRAGL